MTGRGRRARPGRWGGRWCRRPRWLLGVDPAEEAGATTVFFLLLVPAMVVMAGLAYDGGRVLSARREALDTAQNAALAGAQGVDVTGLHQGDVRLAPGPVAARVDDYLATVGASGSHSTTADSVTVVVTETVSMELLGAIGVGPKTVTGTATARIVRGVEGPDT